MISLHTFHRQFESTPKEDKFHMIKTPVEPTSLFVIYQQLTQVRAQQKYFKEREEHLLHLAQLGFEQLTKK